MEIVPNKWKSYRTNRNRTEQMEIEPNKWKSNQTNGNRSEQMEIEPNKWKSNRIHHSYGASCSHCHCYYLDTATYRNLPQPWRTMTAKRWHQLRQKASITLKNSTTMMIAAVISFSPANAIRPEKSPRCSPAYVA